MCAVFEDEAVVERPDLRVWRWDTSVIDGDRVLGTDQLGEGVFKLRDDDP